MGFSQWETNSPRVGKTVVSVFGASIGVYDSSPKARVAATSCLYTAWISESQLSCQVPAGRGVLLPTVVTVGVRKGTSSGIFSYNVPAVSMLVSAPLLCFSSSLPFALTRVRVPLVPCRRLPMPHLALHWC